MTLTKMGKILIVIILALLFAGLNTRSNLMHLFNTFLICIWLLSPMLAQRNLLGIKAKISSPGEVFVNEELSIQVLFGNETNENKYAMVFKDHTCSKDVFIHHIPPQSEILSTYKTTYRHRGVVYWEKISLTTKYPFALFQNKISLSASNKLYILPPVLNVENFSINYFDRYYNNKKQSITNNKTSQDSFSRLRDYIQGDNRRYIDWKASAKKDHLIVREYVDENPCECSVIIAFKIDTPYITGQSEMFEELILATSSITAQVFQKAKLNYFAVGSKELQNNSLKLRNVLRFLAELKMKDIPFIAPEKSYKKLIIVTNVVTQEIKEYLKNNSETTLICTEQNVERYTRYQYTFSVQPNSIRLRVC
ncbi:DUF58 domain-containing protein [Candidatus Uabimicrobium sp. HlEnr_7]|uniref:DUF58 domain-containing protein n=1 Tax=Candidatus Uabimicrobium helgolandensis TaxID=3095367 RepID=UPI003557696E